MPYHVDCRTLGDLTTRKSPVGRVHRNLPVSFAHVGDMCAGPVFSLVFLRCLPQLRHQHSDCPHPWFKGAPLLHSRRTGIMPSSCVALSLDSHTWQRRGVGCGGATFWFVVFEWYKCRPLVRDHRVAKKRPCRRLVVASSNTQWVRFRDCWEDRSASQDVKTNGMIGVSSLVQLLRHCLITQVCG